MKVASRIFTGALLLAAPAAMAQSTLTKNDVPVTVNIYKGLTLTQNSGLVFGNIVNGTGGGSVTMSPGGVPSYSGPITSAPYSALGGTPSAATFTVNGTANQVVNVTIPNAPVSLSGSGSAINQTISVGTFTTNATNPAPGQVTLTSGTANFGVGATLTVGATQVDGPYAGTFQVQVAYN